MFAVLPTLLTLGNAVSGFGSITIAARYGTEWAQGNELFIAGGLIFLAMLFDALDGSAARLTNQTSDFGAQLDSLCDAVSSGVAPAFLMIQFSREYSGRYLWVIAALFVCCAVLRLARFNVETDEEDTHDFFSGLPAPAAAGLVASFPIAMHGLKDWQADASEKFLDSVIEFMIPLMQKGLPVVALFAAFLMVSRVRYVHAFNALIRGRHSRKHLIQILFTIAAIVLFHELALPLVLCYLTFNPPVQQLYKEIRSGRFKRNKMEPTTEDQNEEQTEEQKTEESSVN